ncbi:MAG: glycogen debranching N-terminal domain-containing protein [Ktedonobacterales bacterium]
MASSHSAQKRPDGGDLPAKPDGSTPTPVNDLQPGQLASPEPGFHGSGTPHISDISNAVTTKDNQVFMLTDPGGDIASPENGEGIYFRDMRYLSRMQLLLGDRRPISLLADASRGNQSIFELSNPHMLLPNGYVLPKEHLSIRRTYDLHEAIEQTIEVQNLDRVAVSFRLSLVLASDFEDMMVIRGFLKEPEKRGMLLAPQVTSASIAFAYHGADEHQRSTLIAFAPQPDAIAGGTAYFDVSVQPGATLSLSMTITVVDRGPDDDVEVGTVHTLSSAADKHDAFDSVLARLPAIETSNALFDRALARSFDDLRMLATASHDDVYIAAGIPWYVALFGRDSAITAFEIVGYQPEVALSTLRVLARYQGTVDDDYRDEEPGKILHELRVGEVANLHEIPMTPYYGSVDSTLWFLMLLAEYVRWTGDLDCFRELRDNALQALAWMDRNEAEPLEGYLSYGTRSQKGLSNQGWKDSYNAIVNADGSLVVPPVATVEVQGYAYRARCDMAELFTALGDTQRAAEQEQKAAALKTRVEQRFWMPDQDYYALALQRDLRPARAISSNPGHLLFTGIVDDTQAAKIAQRLMQADLFCGWGIRTLGATEVAYNPLDYQVGSVWPHDNALIALGLAMHGFAQPMERVFTGIFEAATWFNHARLPEVFDGFSQSRYERPVNYPVACSPQAWAAGALPLMLQTALGLTPHALQRELHIRRPWLPAWLKDVTVRGLRICDAQVDLRYQREGDVTLVAVLKREGQVKVTVEY